tara:strand:+ start:686 stop:1759 length:1074 start_codon:yes stop_codon:yes gene_type:complete
MKLIDSIRNVIYEQLEDLEDVEKLFGDDIKSIFNYYKKSDQLEELVALLDYQPLKLVPTLIDTGDKKYEELAWKLIDPYVGGDIIKEGDKYILSLNDREDVTELFKGNTGWSDSDCKHIAELVFQDDLWDVWEPYEHGESVENLLESLSEENYQELVTSLIENYGNKEVENARGEYDHWIEEDNLSDNPKAFILTPDRILRSSEDRYAFTALIDSPDLEDFERIVSQTYGRAYNDVIVSEYFKEYHKALDTILGEGKDVQRGTTQRYKEGRDGMTVPVYKYEFDVTDKFWDVIKLYAEKTERFDIDEYGWMDTLKTVMYDYDYKGGLLCPDVDEYPDEDKVNKVFNDIFIEELKWNL